MLLSPPRLFIGLAIIVVLALLAMLLWLLLGREGPGGGCPASIAEAATGGEQLCLAQ